MNRLLTALIAVPILIAAIVLPYFFPFEYAAKLPFVVIAAAALLAGMYEFFSLTKKMELKADATAGILAAAVLFIAFLFDSPAKADNFFGIAVVSAILIILISQVFRFRVDFSKMLIGTGVTLLGIFYLFFLGGYLVALRMTLETRGSLSTNLLIFFFLVLWIGDSLAYYSGRYLGKHKLAPQISPGKTWEGCIGGMLGSLGAAALASFTFFPELPLQASLPLAAAMNVLGVLGDLTESAIKRGAGAKDAASILPGHGGFLDRLDSLLFNAPLIYYFARIYWA
ncbi:MAG TPA: phosphatidate cytidylyltransferase [Pyrinomonadaceae bacterium]|jgi:phosphatidate cytidylyltransferase|nr:phosphatidate cytidylyltransferase [Pyrinomonadaceae bacterium]